MTRLAAHLVPALRLRDVLRGSLDDLPDADLLDRFAHYGEQESFDALLRRHGPMVHGVCRRLLANSADTDDAFQATFLVFVRRARSLRPGGRLGPWLYGVAVRVALKARARRSRFAQIAHRQTEAIDMIPDPTGEVEPPDWLPILDAELQVLPAKYREPLVLCELQGASRAMAAKALCIPEGTLSSRLARGRELLRKRLLKHGTLLPAGGLVTLLSASGVGRAGMPAVLMAKTSELAAISATGAAVGGVVPAGAAQLMDEVLKNMMLSKLRVVCGGILAVGLMAAGALAARPQDVPDQSEKPKASPQTTSAKARPVKPGSKDAVLPDREALQGLWVVDKVDIGKAPEHAGEAREMIGKMQFLIAGDVWWSMLAGQSVGTEPMRARIDAVKNPKWLDLTSLMQSSKPEVNRCIYEISGDRLRISLPAGDTKQRPAELASDGDSFGVIEFRREKMPPAAGDRALVGSWLTSTSEEIGIGENKATRPFTQRLEILDGYLFVFSTAKGRGNNWIGGKYTVDTTKNPKWVDVELAAPVDGGKITKLYGCYEVVDGQLKMALGTNGKRLTRPLELMNANDVLFLDVTATKEPLGSIKFASASATTSLPKDQPGTASGPVLPSPTPRLKGPMPIKP